MTGQRHDQSYWVMPSRSLTGGCLFLAGLGLLLYLLGRVQAPVRPDAAWLLWLPAIAATSIGASWVFHRPHPVTAYPSGPAGPADTAALTAPGADPGPQIVMGGGDLERVRQLLTGGKFPFELIPTDVGYNDRGQLVRYALHALVPGYLSDRRNATMVTQRLQGAVPGDWLVEIEAPIDKVSVNRKKPFPVAVAPPLPARLVSSPAESAARYRDFSVGIGVDELGRRLEFDFKTYHHWLIIGPTGTGKSVLLRGMIEEIRAQGAALWIADGKNSDYSAMVGLANIVMVSASNAEHVRLVHAAYEELARRRKIGEERKQAGLPLDFTPWVVILDEFATMRNEISAAFEEYPLKDKRFVEDLRALFKVGREFRIHIIVATQDLYASTIPRDILNMCRLVITFGQPSEMTLKQAFNDEMQPKARQLGQSISPEAQGRGVVAIPELATVKEFQGYYAYSPAANMDDPKLPDHIKSAWRTYRDTVSARIPKLYSRQWFRVEEPDLALPMVELNDLEMVNLDLADGTPDPTMVQYDKQHDAYNGNMRGQMRPGALREIVQHTPSGEDSYPAATVPAQLPRPRPVVPEPAGVGFGDDFMPDDDNWAGADDANWG